MTSTLNIILALFIGGLIMISLLLIFYLMFVRNENRAQSLLLTLVFLSVTIRISKSSVFFLFGNISLLVKAIGFLGLAMIAPIAYLYFRNSHLKKPIFLKTDIIHFMFPFFGFIIYLQLSGNAIISLYHLGTFILLIYLLVITKMLLNANGDENKKNAKKFNFNLLIGLYAIWTSFVIQHVCTNEQAYLLGVILSTIIVFIMFLYILKTKIIIPSNRAITLPESLISKVKSSIEKDKLYRKPEIKLSSFSEEINEPAYMVSKAIKLIYNKNFPDVINSFRVSEIKKELESSSIVKIESLAFGAGFNSVSSFYYAFKKETSMSPRAYQNKCFQDSTHSS